MWLNVLDSSPSSPGRRIVHPDTPLTGCHGPRRTCQGGDRPGDPPGEDNARDDGKNRQYQGTPSDSGGQGAVGASCRQPRFPPYSFGLTRFPPGPRLHQWALERRPERARANPMRGGGIDQRARLVTHFNGKSSLTCQRQRRGQICGTPCMALLVTALHRAATAWPRSARCRAVRVVTSLLANTKVAVANRARATSATSAMRSASRRAIGENELPPRPGAGNGAAGSDDDVTRGVLVSRSSPIPGKAQPVTSAEDRLNDSRRSRIGFDLAAKVLHV